MLKRGMLGLIAVVAVVLIGREATLAQKFQKVTPPPGRSMPTKEEPKSWKGRAQPPGGLEEDNLPPPAVRSSEIAEAEPVAGDDPMKAVDTFLNRNRKEADESIKALTKEAETLRARLQKVEAALARWQTVAGALGHDGKGANPFSVPDATPQLEAIQPPAANETPPTAGGILLPPPGQAAPQTVPAPGDPVVLPPPTQGPN